MEKTREEIREYLRNNNCNYEDLYINSMGLVEIIVDGDWKHDHGYLVDKMEEFGFTQLSNEEIGHSEDDWYMSKHTFGETEFVKAARAMFGIEV